MATGHFLCYEVSIGYSRSYVAPEAPIKSILYYRDSSWKQCENLEQTMMAGDLVIRKHD